MNNKFISCLVLTFFSSLSLLHSQSVNLDSFAQIQGLNIQKCAVVQVNASWNHALQELASQNACTVLPLWRRLH